MRGVNRESREITLENAKRRISSMAGSLGLTAHHTESAFRLFLLALQHNFVRGRKSEYVISSCLYVVCRREKTARTPSPLATTHTTPTHDTHMTHTHTRHTHTHTGHARPG
jgi:transcription initiation factor TFIIIB Brf1 subunit/transcription initiation factor TFIIB